MNDTEYFINKVSDKAYDIVKLVNGVYNTTYSVLIGKASMTCNCISGHIRGYCHHKDRIRDILDGRQLPNNFHLVEKINQKDLDNLVEEVSNGTQCVGRSL